MTRRIRVARIITRLNIGGPAIQAMLLTKRLDPSRYETLLVCGVTGPREGDMRILRSDHGLSPTVVPELRREISPAADLKAFLRLVRVLRTYRPDIVHTHMAKAGLLGRLAARVVGAPVVIHTFHGNVLSGYFGPAATHLFLTLERLLARLSTRIIAISARQAAELRSLRIADGRLAVIPLGLDLQPFLDPPRGLLRRELEVSPAAPLVGIVARLVPIKGVDVFLAAAAEVAAARSDAVFVVVGDGELRGSFERQAMELGLADHSRFLGWRADLPSIYADLDVVALTSRNEGTPVSVIEALAAGRAVVATAVGGVPDLLGDSRCGVLVGDGDARALARAILSLLGDPSRRRELGRSGRARVYPAYDAAMLVARIDELYASLCGAR